MQTVYKHKLECLLHFDLDYVSTNLSEKLNQN